MFTMFNTMGSQLAKEYAKKRIKELYSDLENGINDFNFKEFTKSTFFNDVPVTTTKKDYGFDIEVEVPGFSKEEIKITLNKEKTILAINAKNEKRKFSYEYEFPLSATVKGSKLENGILTISVNYVETESNKETEINID
jgi:HSP20 family molecular chaperone IbpA